MPRLTNTAPNRILGHEMLVVSEDPLIVLLTLDTDDGTFEFAVNEDGVRHIMTSMAEALELYKPE